MGNNLVSIKENIDNALGWCLHERYACWSCGEVYKDVFAASNCCPPPKAYWCKQHQVLLRSESQAHGHLVIEHAAPSLALEPKTL